MIQKKASTAMYIQIADILRQEISSQCYAPGSCLATQSQLAKRFGVSLMTIKKALELLEQDHLVVSCQGKGTFVRDTLLQESSGNLMALTSVFEKQHLQPEVVILSMGEIDTPQSLPSNVVTEIGSRCFCIDRLHSLNNKPIGYTKIYVPVDLGIKLKKNDLSEDSLYHICQKKFGMTLGQAIQTICAGKADDIAEILRINENSPILIVGRESYQANGRLFEYAVKYFEYSQYSFRIKLDISQE